ncbi:hypothetical protein ECG_02468 [Echinococcus granulosus]|nr:hypothetical protein ECG_02468 [Echinococcus granulosus]
MDYPKRQFMFRFHENIYKAHDFIFDKKTTRQIVPDLCPMIVPGSAPYATFCSASSSAPSNGTCNGSCGSSPQTAQCGAKLQFKGGRKMREESMSYVKKRLLALRMYDHIMNKKPNQQSQMQQPQPLLTPSTPYYHGWGSASPYSGNALSLTHGHPVAVVRSPYLHSGRTCQKSPSTFGNVCQCSALPRCCRSSPSAQGEAMGTYYQPLERNPIQPFGCLDFPKTTATSNISTGTMAYLCKLNTPLRKTEHLFADGNCVRARRSIVELGDLNTLNNCTTSCPMIAEHCTYKQQHQHHGCTENPDECRSLQDVRLTMAHSRKVKETSSSCQLNTSMARSKLCSQVFQSLVDSTAYSLIFTMPVGCFPSFRRKIKKFNKGKAPLSRKEEAKNDISRKSAKPTEVNNHAEAKAESSASVEQQVEVALQRQEEGKGAQNIDQKTFEQVAEVHQPIECVANELVTFSEPTEHNKEINESYKCETASPGATIMEYEGARETAPNAEIEYPCEAPPTTGLIVKDMEVGESAVLQKAESPCEAPPTEAFVEHEEVEESNLPQEHELQGENVPPTEEIVEFVVDQESVIPQEAESPCEAPPTEAFVEHEEVEESNLPQEHELQGENVPPTEEIVEFVVDQESVIPQEAESPCEAPPTEAFVEHEEVEESNLPQEHELQGENVPPTEEIVEFVVDQESVIPQEAESPCEAPPTEPFVEHEEVEESNLPQEHELQGENVPPTEEIVEFVVDQESVIPQEAESPCEAVPTVVERDEVQKFSEPPEIGATQESVENAEGKPSQIYKSEQPFASEEEHTEAHNSSELKVTVLPKGFHWVTTSVPLPEGAIDIHELHLPMHVGLVETGKGEIPCKYLEAKRTFYAGIDGREQDFACGKILCLDPNIAESIEIEWVHVSTSDIRSRNLVAGARDAGGKLLYIARGMIPLNGPYPYYELSSGWVSEDLEYAHLPYGGVEWEQHDFDVLTWKPRCC